MCSNCSQGSRHTCNSLTTVDFFSVETVAQTVVKCSQPYKENSPLTGRSFSGRMNAMNNQENNQQSNDVDNKGDGGVGKVDRELASPGTQAKPWRTPTGQLLPGHPYRFTSELQPPAGTNQGRGKTLIALTEELRVASVTENSERILEVGRKWLQSNDPFVQKLYFEYFAGKPKQQVALPAPGQNNIDVMRLAMAEEARAKQAEAELAKLKAELEGRTIDIAKRY